MYRIRHRIKMRKQGPKTSTNKWNVTTVHYWWWKHRTHSRLNHCSWKTGMKSIKGLFNFVCVLLNTHSVWNEENIEPSPRVWSSVQRHKVGERLDPSYTPFPFTLRWLQNMVKIHSIERKRNHKLRIFWK